MTAKRFKEHAASEIVFQISRRCRSRHGGKRAAEGTSPGHHGNRLLFFCSGLSHAARTRDVGKPLRQKRGGFSPRMRTTFCQQEVEKETRLAGRENGEVARPFKDSCAWERPSTAPRQVEGRVLICRRGAGCTLGASSGQNCTISPLARQTSDVQ